MAKRAGLVLDPWQKWTLKAGLAERSDGRMASFKWGIICPRQNGKNAILEAAELYWLFLDDAVELITHTAHRFDTAQEHYHRIAALVRGCPELMDEVAAIPKGNGSESIVLKNGKRLLFKARAKASGVGFSGDRVVLDEAFYLKGLGSLLPTMAAREDPQLVWTSSAPHPGPESDVLRTWMTDARRGDDGIYLEWSAPEGTDPDDRSACKASNPSYGIRLDPAYVWGMERTGMTEEEFLRERMGVFPDPEDGRRWQAITEGAWSACRSMDPHDHPGRRWMADPVGLGLYVAGDQSWAAIGASGRCRDGGWAIELIDYRTRTDWVVDRLVQLCEDHDVTKVALQGKTSAAVFIDALETLGVPVTDCHGRDEMIAAQTFWSRLLAGDLWHPDDPKLNESAALVEVRAPSGSDSWVWNTRGNPDALPIAAVTLAMWAAEREPDPVEDWDVLFV